MHVASQSGRSLHRLAGPLVLLAAAGPALAHDAHHAHDAGASGAGFVSGLAHPVSGLDHIAAMVAVGVWGAQLGRPALWLLPVMFPIVMALGGFLGLIGVPLPGVEIGIAASAIVLGAMVAAAVRPPLWTGVLLVSAFAIFHGHAHGTELPEDQSGLLYSIGFVLSTGLLHAAGIGLGLINHWPRGGTILRALGGVITAAGAYFMWGALA